MPTPQYQSSEFGYTNTSSLSMSLHLSPSQRNSIKTLLSLAQEVIYIFQWHNNQHHNHALKVYL